MTISADTAIQLQDVGKRYSKVDEQPILLRSVMPFWRPKRSDLWALDDVNLEIQRGETVGILGRNGAGKTTLLRLLAGVTQPSRGQVLIRGRVAPLISVGVGFHQEMSGRENVYVNGMLLGLTRKQVDDRFDEIVAFAELENFIDTPVKFYSSGMYMRLGFAVAIFSDPDVLLVDEVLAVGDVVFQLKCFERMREIQDRGTTIIMVSHSMHAIRLLCPRVLVISAGRLEFDGDTADGINTHFDLLSRERHRDIDGISKLPVEVLDREIGGPEGPTFHLPLDGPATFRARLVFHDRVERPQIQLQVFSSGVFVYERRTITGLSRTFEPGEVVQIEVPFQQHLGAATFRFALNVLDNAGAALFSDHIGLLVYAASDRPGSIGLVDLEADIVVDGEVQTVVTDMLLGSRSSVPMG